MGINFNRTTLKKIPIRGKRVHISMVSSFHGTSSSKLVTGPPLFQFGSRRTTVQLEGETDLRFYGNINLSLQFGLTLLIMGVLRSSFIFPTW